MDQTEQGYAIEQFKMMRGFDTGQAEAFKNAAAPVVRVPLRENQRIAYIDSNDRPRTITNAAQRETDIVIFGSSVMYNEDDVKVADAGEPGSWQR